VSFVYFCAAPKICHTHSSNPNESVAFSTFDEPFQPETHSRTSLLFVGIAEEIVRNGDWQAIRQTMADNWREKVSWQPSDPKWVSTSCCCWWVVFYARRVGTGPSQLNCSLASSFSTIVMYTTPPVVSNEPSFLDLRCACQLRYGSNKCKIDVNASVRLSKLWSSFVDDPL